MCEMSIRVDKGNWAAVNTFKYLFCSCQSCKKLFLTLLQTCSHLVFPHTSFTPFTTERFAQTFALGMVGWTYHWVISQDTRNNIASWLVPGALFIPVQVSSAMSSPLHNELKADHFPQPHRLAFGGQEDCQRHISWARCPQEDVGLACWSYTQLF